MKAMVHSGSDVFLVVGFAIINLNGSFTQRSLPFIGVLKNRIESSITSCSFVDDINLKALANSSWQLKDPRKRFSIELPSKYQSFDLK